MRAQRADIFFQKGKSFFWINIPRFAQSPADAFLHVIVLVLNQGFDQRENFRQREHFLSLRTVVQQTHDGDSAEPGIWGAIPLFQCRVNETGFLLQDAGVDSAKRVGVRPVVDSTRPLLQHEPVLCEHADALAIVKPCQSEGHHFVTVGILPNFVPDFGNFFWLAMGERKTCA